MKMITYGFSGITNDSKDPSVDTFRSTTLPLLKRFGVPSEGLELKILSRGVAPKGGGEVTISVPIIHNSLKVDFVIYHICIYSIFMVFLILTIMVGVAGCYMD